MPKTVDHEKYRKELLGKCFEIFSRKGYGKVTMREIAAEISVSTGTLYHYFPNKENILEQLFEWAVDHNIGHYNRDAQPNLPFHRKLKSMAEFWNASESFYKNLLLLGMDLFRARPSDSENIFFAFKTFYQTANAKSLGANSRLSDVIFIYFLGCVVMSLFMPSHFSFHKEVRFVINSVETLYSLRQKGSGEKALRSVVLEMTTPDLDSKETPHKKSSRRVRSA